MQLSFQTKEVGNQCKGAVVAIGNFDGVHLGHQKLLGAADNQAKVMGRPLGVLTFEHHPRSLFRPEEPFFRLSSPSWKMRLLKGLGVQCLDVATFETMAIAMMSAIPI